MNWEGRTEERPNQVRACPEGAAGERGVLCRLGHVVGRISLCAALLLVGCADPGASTDEGSGETDAVAAEVSAEIDTSGMDFAYSDRDKDASYDTATATAVSLEGESVSVEGSGAVSKGSTVTVQQGGTYILSGSLDSGQLVVDAPEDEKVQLVFSGASISNDSGCALYVKQVDKVFLTLEEGSENSLSDGEGYVSEDDEDVPNAALYSESDLTINGEGALSVSGNSLHGVHSKDDLVVTGGTVEVTSVADALRGRDCVKIADGDFSIDAGGDAVKSNNDEDGTRGFVSIDGGSFQVSAGDDAFHAETVLNVNGGDIEVTACTEGLEAEQVGMNGGEVSIVSSDDGVNASLRSAAGSSTEEAPADQAAAAPEGASANQPPAAPEGAAPDQAPAAPEGGAPAGAAAQAPDTSAAQPAASSDCVVSITGGRLVVDSGGDAIDSNGSISVSGGLLLACGPSTGDNCTLDYETTAEVTGGTVLVLGQTAMAQGFSGGTQAFFTANVSGASGQTVCVADGEGNVLASIEAIRDFQWVCASCPQMEEGEALQLVLGGDVQGADSDGFASSGSVSGGSATEVTASCTAVQGSGAGAMPGGGGFGGASVEPPSPQANDMQAQ